MANYFHSPSPWVEGANAFGEAARGLASALVQAPLVQQQSREAKARLDLYGAQAGAYRFKMASDQARQQKLTALGEAAKPAMAEILAGGNVSEANAPAFGAFLTEAAKDDPGSLLKVATVLGRMRETGSMDPSVLAALVTQTGNINAKAVELGEMTPDAASSDIRRVAGFKGGEVTPPPAEGDGQEVEYVRGEDGKLRPKNAAPAPAAVVKPAAPAATPPPPQAATKPSAPAGQPYQGGVLGASGEGLKTISNIGHSIMGWNAKAAEFLQQVPGGLKDALVGGNSPAYNPMGTAPLPVLGNTNAPMIAPLRSAPLNMATEQLINGLTTEFRNRNNRNPATNSEAIQWGYELGLIDENQFKTLTQ